MLSITNRCEPVVSRREWLRLGALAPMGLSLAGLLAAEEQRAAGSVASRNNTGNSKPRAKSCLLIFLEGGPSHIDLWDMKPGAPVEIRGEFQPVRTTVPGLVVCEYLPKLSQQMHHLALVRSMRHSITDHNAGTYYMLTGKYPVEGSKLIVGNSATNFPPFGAVLAKLRPTRGQLPDFVHIPEYQSNNGVDIAGQSAGFLGAAFDPFITGDPSLPNYSLPGLSPLPEVPAQRLANRSELLARLDRPLAQVAQAGANPALTRAGVFTKKAFELIGSPAVRRAFDLSREPTKVRERYGVDPGSDRSLEARKFGGLPHLGQCMLLARRLIESGVRLVTLITGRRVDQAWDTHRQHFPLLKRALCPPFDQALSALLEDMALRGLLDETLVVITGEFGRTPKLGQVSSNAGAAPNGRDHWPYCYTALLAGAGISAGAVVGASDNQGAYPRSESYGPEDLAATIYELMGVPTATEIRDPLDRPHTLATGSPIRALLV